MTAPEGDGAAQGPDGLGGQGRRVHLVDGTYELFRAFYGPPPATAPDGREVGATRGLLRSLWSLLTEAPGATHVGVAFDTVIESFRNELFAGYKTGAGIDPALWGQFPLAERAAAALGVVVWRMVAFEADDAMASAAARLRDDPRVDRVFLCSPDKDLAQCVRGDRVVLLDRRRRLVLDEAAVRDKWGVGPDSIPDWLALVGDSADGLPGVPRWGAKSASTLLAAYQTLDRIPADPAAWSVRVRGAKGLAEALVARREDARLYRRLATLREDAPLGPPGDLLAQLAWKGPDRSALAALCEEIGDRAFLDRLA
ncbi:MAG TPA: 5'-3' exonuclease H3TH domain-containing protein [Polyangiaceae bacterium LLY-WYZ-14_1]|nr:5'-3' exonuclease H3TH domain-containing protein [Polyangiaceae bacterium LLY-WYZ-14_1]